jgi:3-hydroxyisobutyrate dehydrogenase-like beta-hydroxyacid dehydrogenase
MTIKRVGLIGMGSAHRLKLINNFVAISHAAVPAEAITVAARAGGRHAGVTRHRHGGRRGVHDVRPPHQRAVRFVPRLIDVLMKVNGLRN